LTEYSLLKFYIPHFSGISHPKKKKQAGVKSVYQGFFFLPRLWYSHIGNHPHEDLAIFGYKISRIVKTNLYSCYYCLATCRGMRSKSGEPSPKTLLFPGDFFQNI
jgi:hypothetical protein